jgi:serine/threonine protein kinase
MLDVDGCRLGAWQLTQVLHRGRWSTLLRARPIETGDGLGCYVVKAATAQGNQRDVARAMLAREADVGERMSHPHLLTHLAVHLRGDVPYLVRPYLEGLTLRQLLVRQCGPADVASALWTARQVAQALSALHHAGWLHGQLRPEHVLVSSQGHATLIDLALARRLGTEECTADIWRPGAGTYAAPELLAACGRATPASDTYSMGLLLYELLTGCVRREGGDTVRPAVMNGGQMSRDVRALRPDAPGEVAHLLRLMMAQEPLRRPSDEDLVRWLTELEIAALQ